MKIYWIVAAIGLVGTSSFAGTIPAGDSEKLKRIALSQISQDFRIVFHEEKDVHICGGQGDAYIGQVQMNIYSRGYDANGSKVSDNWVDIDRRYSIFKREFSEPHPRLFDSDHQCME